MENIVGLERWNQYNTEYKDEQQNILYYFKREMGKEKACTKIYFSHIFIRVYQKQNELLDDWKNINRYIALKYQSKLENLIEKSNFYLCLIVSEKVITKIKDKIESDSFCAKKYVFDENNKTLQENLLDIEKKIFCISLPTCLKTFPKLGSIVLQNFRGYGGRCEISFKDFNGKSASFIAIYAKNGVGKTSLFDGVEFALKGEIGRIIQLTSKDRKNKLQGPVYHNRNKADQDAFVLLVLDNGKIILRNVANMTEEGTDCRVIPAKKGREITGTIEDKEKWNQIILPHDKIDSFISAKSPTDQYTEWVDSTGAVKKESMEFEEAYMACKNLEKTYSNLKDECIKIVNRLTKLEETKSAVDMIKKLVDSYNNIAERNHRLFFSTEFTVEQYDRLINDVLKYIRMLNGKRGGMELRISVAKDILNKGVESIKTIFSSVDEIDKFVQTLEVRVHRKKELNSLLQLENENVKALGKYQKEVEFLQKITNYGIDRVHGSYKKYCYIGEKISELERTLQYYEKELNELITAEERASLKRKENKFFQMSEEEVLEVSDNAKKLDEINEEIKKIQVEHLATEENNKQCEQSVAFVTDTIGRIVSFQLPGDISELNSKELLNIELILDDDMRSQLYSFEERYNETLLRLQMCQADIAKQEKRNELLDEICQKGKEYLKLHKDVTVCPLCHTSFDNWETLFLKINNVREDDSLLARLLEGYRREIESVSEAYKAFRLKCNNLKEQYIEKLKVDQSNLLKESGKWMAAKIQYEKNRDSLNKKRGELERWFIQKDIMLSEFSYMGFETWLDCQSKYMSQIEEEINNIKEKRRVIQAFVNNNKIELNGFVEQKNRIVNDSELYGYIDFWMKYSGNVDIPALLHEKDIMLKECLEKKKEIQEKIKDYSDVVDVDLKKCMELKDAKIFELDRLKELKEKYNIFEVISEDAVNKKLNDWINEKECYEKQEEYLRQITEESGARHYFDNYRKYNQELEMKKEEAMQQEKKIEEARKVFVEKKGILEKALKSYFNYSMMNEIYKKIDPHELMKDVEYDLSFNSKDDPQLCIRVCESGNLDSYRPEWYFSTAQLNTVAFSSFFSRALIAENLEFRTIFIDDPIGHFDDMNILGFTDMIRSILETNDCQIIMSTHDEKIFRILERKLDAEYYSSCFIRLPESEAVKWSETY